MRQPPTWSIVALCCPPVMLGVLYFLTTQEGRSFNEEVFGRFYTLGAILMLGAYGVLFLGLLAIGAGAAIRAWKRGETPAFMPKLALAVNLGVPLAILVYRSYF